MTLLLQLQYDDVIMHSCVHACLLERIHAELC